MKLRALVIFGGMLLAAGVSAQTLTDVINEFNTGVEKVNNQEYDVAIQHFTQAVNLSETVGDEANEMKVKAEEQIPAAYYRQATLFLKRQQFDNAIPSLEKCIEYATLYNNNDEFKEKASRYLLQSYMREGQRNFRNQAYEDALALYDKALAMNESIYQAHLGKGMVYLAQDESEQMMEAFSLAKDGAEAKGDSKTIDQINKQVDNYFNAFIMEEVSMVDPEEKDYTYVVEACEKALAANPTNPRALYHLAMVSNKNSEYSKAAEYAEKALAYEEEAIWQSAINYELGYAFEYLEEFQKSCTAYRAVSEDPFLAQAERRMGNVCE